MDEGLKDLIDELRDYAAPRRGELAGMLLEAANRLEELATKKADDIGDCTIADVVRHNMAELRQNYLDARDADELDKVDWWVDECGSDLTESIDCHVIFQGDPPCLLDARSIPFDPNTYEDRQRKLAACSECKALWLMQPYE